MSEEKQEPAPRLSNGNPVYLAVVLDSERGAETVIHIDDQIDELALLQIIAPHLEILRARAALRFIDAQANAARQAQRVQLASALPPSAPPPPTAKKRR